MAVFSQLQINGSVVPNITQTTVRKSTSQNNASSSFTANINNYIGEFADDYTVGDTVEIFADVDTTPPTTKIFSGILENTDFNGKEQKEKLILSGKDFTARLIDRTVEPEVYNNLPAGSIVQDILLKYTDDITDTNVQLTNTTIDRITFNQTPVFDAIRQLAEQSNSVFFIDNDQDLHFEPKSETSSDLTFDNTNVLQAKFKEKRNSVYNEVWVYGDRYLDGVVETFSGTGSTDVITLLNSPHNTLLTVDGVVQTGGITNMITQNTVSGIDYTVSFLDKTLTFQSGTDIGYNAIPVSGATIVANYKRELPIIKVGKDNDSIATYGKRIKVIQDKNIKDPVTAQQQMATELAENSIPAKEGTINVKGVVDVTPSQTCVVNIPFHNINNQTYDILEASYKFNDLTENKEDVLTLKVNKKLADVSDTIKQMLLDIKKIQGADISTSDILTRFELATGSVGIRQSGIQISTATITQSGLYCFWDGGDSTITGTLASGTDQKGLFGTGVGSPFGPHIVQWSGGYF